MDAQELGVVYSGNRVMDNMDRTLFVQVVYQGFSSSVSVWSLRRCNQLPSPFSLVRTLVVRNTAALFPSETQTCACHIPTHHLRYYTHCGLHHNDILITVWLIACMIFSPLWGRHTPHNQPLVVCIKSERWQNLRSQQPGTEICPLTPSAFIGGTRHLTFSLLTVWHARSRGFSLFFVLFSLQDT